MPAKEWQIRRFGFGQFSKNRKPMCQNQQITSDESTSGTTIGRRLLQSALQRNPLMSLLSNLVGPIVGLFRRRRAKPPGSIRKMKLESYSYSPIGAPTRRLRESLEAPMKAERRDNEGRPRAEFDLERLRIRMRSRRRSTAPRARARPARRGKKGGRHHG